MQATKAWRPRDGRVTGVRKVPASGAHSLYPGSDLYAEIGARQVFNDPVRWLVRTWLGGRPSSMAMPPAVRCGSRGPTRVHSLSAAASAPVTARANKPVQRRRGVQHVNRLGARVARVQVAAAYLGSPPVPSGNLVGCVVALPSLH